MPSSLTAALPRAVFITASNSAPSKAVAPAVHYFDAATLDEARPSARAVYANSIHCTRCRSVLNQRFARLGSTLFRDDDPRALARAFDSADRDGCTVRLLAACIVLFGRDREQVQ